MGAGLGHFYRCFSLASELARNSIQTELIIDSLRVAKGEVDTIKLTERKWQGDPDFIQKIADGTDIIVVDSYHADVEVYNLLSSLTGLGIYFDDYNRTNYPSGIVVNGSISAKSLNYPIRNDIEYLLGPRYQVLRREFIRARRREQRTCITSILITFGADDLRNLTPKVLSILVAEFFSAKKIVIVGPGYNNIDKIRDASDGLTEIIFKPNAKGMYEAMYSCDIAVCSGGQTLNELAAVGVPAVTIQVAENQSLNINGWEAAGFIKNVGWWNQSNIFNQIVSSIQFFQDYENRILAARKASEILDTLGVERVAEEALQAISLGNRKH